MTTETISQRSTIFRGDDIVKGGNTPCPFINPSFEDDMWVSSFDENGDFLEVSFEASPDHKSTNIAMKKNLFHVVAARKRSRQGQQRSAPAEEPRRKEFAKRLSHFASRVSTSIKVTTNATSSLIAKMEKEKKQKGVKQLSKKFLRKLEKERKRKQSHSCSPISAAAHPAKTGYTTAESKEIGAMSQAANSSKLQASSLDASSTAHEQTPLVPSSDTIETEHSEKSDVGESSNIQILYTDQQVTSHLDYQNADCSEQTDQKPDAKCTTTRPRTEAKVDVGPSTNKVARCLESSGTSGSEETNDIGERANTTILYSDQQVSSTWGNHDQQHQTDGCTSTAVGGGHSQDQTDLSNVKQYTPGSGADTIALCLDSDETSEIETSDSRNKPQSLSVEAVDLFSSQDMALAHILPRHDATATIKKKFDYRTNQSKAKILREAKQAEEDSRCAFRLKTMKQNRLILFALFLLLASITLMYKT